MWDMAHVWAASDRFLPLSPNWLVRNDSTCLWITLTQHYQPKWEALAVLFPLCVHIPDPSLL